jgi:hypothetical protein
MSTSIKNPTSINKNLAQIRDPNLRDLLDLYKRELMLDFSCHHVATIQSFNLTNQTVQATINYQKTVFIQDNLTKEYIPKLIEYPILSDCPAVIINGGDTWLNMPIKKGDQCILLFNDRDIDNWFNGSTTSGNATPRLHSFSDAIALIGVNNLNTSISNYDSIRAMLTNGTVKNGINPNTNKLTLTNGTSLNDLLQNLCTQLQNLTTALATLTVTGVVSGTGNSGIPVNATIITNIGVQISTIAVNISQLIE